VAADNRRALGLLELLANAPQPTLDDGDTTHLDAIDHEGNMVAATPSGGWIGSSPVIEGLGFPLGTRGQMFYLNPKRPNGLAPRKRPRATLSPSLVTQEGQPFMVFGTPGGDAQDQLTLQFFLNYVHFQMSIQEAAEAPIVYSVHFPASFFPRSAFPGRIVIEEHIPTDVRAELESRGHEVEVTDGAMAGKVMGIRFDSQRGVMSAGVSPRRTIGYALGW
jgi:gamma-glutamyltranspeptidase/glutathione hydrolase